MPIYGRHHWPDQIRERLGKSFQLGIVRMFQDILVQVTYQMNQTLLLAAGNPVITGIKIGYQDACEVL